MPKSLGNEPEHLRPYLHHGLELRYEGTGEANGDCLFCGGERKLFVSQANGMFHCKVCDANGNQYTFLRMLHAESSSLTAEADLALVAEERKVSVASMRRWGLVQSAIDREWLLSSYHVNGKPVEDFSKLGIYNLYRWSKPIATAKRRLIATAGISHGLFNLHNFDPTKPDVWICEGPWDGMRIDDEIRLYALGEDGKAFFAKSLPLDHPLRFSNRVNIVAVPGCEVFREEWVKIFVDKNVYLAYDSDYPRKYKAGHVKANEFILHKDGSKTIPGWDGMKSAARKLLGAAATISVLRWGDEGYNPSFNDGTDIRDILNASTVPMDS